MSRYLPHIYAGLKKDTETKSRICNCVEYLETKTAEQVRGRLKRKREAMTNRMGEREAEMVSGRAYRAIYRQATISCLEWFLKVTKRKEKKWKEKKNRQKEKDPMIETCPGK